MNNLLKPLLFSLAFTIPAVASADIETKQVEVNEVVISYTTADLASNFGRTELERQIRRAAEQVCGAQNLVSGRVGTLRQLMDNRECYKEAVEKALSSINATA
ncbi:MAG: UrcA family protein [Pseudomonadales bacterium]|nr:UrcA family protein [Pseudomonadales bacterium]